MEETERKRRREGGGNRRNWGKKRKEERWIHYKGWFREKLEESQLTRRWTLLLLRSTLVFCIRRASSVYTPFLLYISSFRSSYPTSLFSLFFLFLVFQCRLPFFPFFLIPPPPPPPPSEISILWTSVFTSSDHGEFSPLSANSFPADV